MFYIIDTITKRMVATRDDDDLAQEIAHKYNNYEDSGRHIVTALVKDKRNHVINKR